MSWRPQDVQDARAVVYLLKKADNMEVNQLKWKFVGGNKDEKGAGVLKTALTLDIEIQSLGFVQLVSCLALWITFKWLDESQKTLWTFNIVETAIDYGDLWSWTKCILHYAMFRYGPHRLIYLDKSMGARDWNVMGCIYLAQRVALLEGVALL